jgi:hypothetical protein
VWVCSDRRPVALVFDALVWNGALDDEHERIETALFRFIEKLHKVVAVLVSEHGIVQINLGQSGDGSEQHILDAWLLRRRNGDAVAIATETGRDPENVDFLYR